MNKEDIFLIKKCPICNSNHIKIKKYSKILDFYGSIEGRFFFNKCLKCGNLFLGNPLKENLISKAYSHNYGAYTKMKFNNIRTIFIHYQAKKLLQSFKDGKLKVLEIGAGEGIFSKYFKSKGHYVTAIDLDKGSVNRLKKQGINALIGNFEDINLKEKFDIIIMSHVIEHFYQPVPEKMPEKTCLFPACLFGLRDPPFPW